MGCVSQAQGVSGKVVYAAVCLIGLLMASCQEPPIHEIEKARQAVEKAKLEGASIYAPDLFSLAESELAVGEEEIQAQKDKIFWKRDYSMAARLADLAQSDALEAWSLTQEVKQKSFMTKQEPAS